MQRIIHGLISVLCVLCMLLFFACHEGPAYSEYKATPDPWNYADSIQFKLPAADTSLAYDMYLKVEHTASYPFQNIYLKFTTHFPSSRRTESQINIDLADKAGRWNGRCTDEVCFYTYPIREYFSFTELGTYNINVEQATRTENLAGIKSLELQLESSRIGSN